MKRLMNVVISAALVAGSGAALGQESKSDKNRVMQTTRGVAHDTKRAAKATGRAVKRGTKKGVHKAAEVTRKGAGKVEQKTQTK
jgi:Ni/Co efflux regulator RcnB